MRIEDYPPQEPLSAANAAYHAEVMRRAARAPAPDIEVAYGDDPHQRISLYLAPEPGGGLLAFIHGGNWTSGYREWMAFMAPAFTDAGVTFASIGYRLAPEHLFPAGFDDCCTAMAWLYGAALDHGADPGRLFVGGHSAGGHYAALMAVRRDWGHSRGLPATAIRGCLPISGVFTFTGESGLPTRPRFLGPRDDDLAASPIHSIQGPAPPFLIAYGDKDSPYLITQAAAFEAALRDRDADVERLVLRGCDHFAASYAGGDAEGPWVGRALAWMAAR